MKKILFLLIIFVVSGCQNQSDKIRVLLPEGIPAIALGGLFDQQDIEFTVVAGPDLLTSELVQDNYDIIVAPLTAGAKLYMINSSNYKLDSVLTFGNTYLVSREDISLESLGDLDGKTIAAYARNNTPDIVLRLALSRSEVEADIVYERNVNEVLTNRFMTNKVDYILIAEPVLSTVIHNLEIDLNIIDLQKELMDEIEVIPQAAIFIKEDNPRIREIINLVEDNTVFLNANPNQYAQKLMEQDIYKYPIFSRLGENIIEQSIPRSNIGFLNAFENKTLIETYLTLIKNSNPELIGEIPDEDFYIKK